MAFHDNPHWIIQHIHHAFVTSDDTGLCELIFMNDTDVTQKQREQEAQRQKKLVSTTWPRVCTRIDEENEEVDDAPLFASSLEILPDMQGIHRPRSNTVVRLEQLRIERKEQTKCKHIQWKEPQAKLSAEDMSRLFQKKHLEKKTARQEPYIVIEDVDGDIKFVQAKSSTEQENYVPEVEKDAQPDRRRKISRLSEQLEKCQTAPANAFNEFAKFDGKAQMGGQLAKKIQIWLPMQPKKDFPMPIYVVQYRDGRDTLVSDLIGLICWQYITENRHPPLKSSAEFYSLHIAEDSGEPDQDFPPLDPTEKVAKFGFSSLVLVEITPQKNRSTRRKVLVTINIPHGNHRGISKLQVAGMDVKMESILEMAMKKRKRVIRANSPRYILEKQSEPGVAIDLHLPLSAMNTLEFCLLREHSTRGDLSNSDSSEDEDHPTPFSSMQYQSFNVSMLHKLLTNTDIVLGISGDKIEIDPVQQGARLFGKQKAVTYRMDSICNCDTVEEKFNRRGIFRVWYFSGHDFKHHDFETSIATARKIVMKIKACIELRPMSDVRASFLKKFAKRQRQKHPFSKGVDWNF